MWSVGTSWGNHTFNTEQIRLKLRLIDKEYP